MEYQVRTPFQDYVFQRVFEYDAGELIDFNSMGHDWKHHTSAIDRRAYTLNWVDAMVRLAHFIVEKIPFTIPTNGIDYITENKHVFTAYKRLIVPNPKFSRHIWLLRVNPGSKHTLNDRFGRNWMIVINTRRNILPKGTDIEFLRSIYSPIECLGEDQLKCTDINGI
jgi:hypothetical protein